MFICVIVFVLFYFGVIHSFLCFLLLYCVLGLLFEKEPNVGWQGVGEDLMDL